MSDIRQSSTCRIATPHKTYYQGSIVEALLPGEQGQFGILADHEPAIIALTYGMAVITSKQAKEYFFLSPGIAHIRDNEVNILVEQVIDIHALENASTIDGKVLEAKHNVIIDLGTHESSAVSLKAQAGSLSLHCKQLPTGHDAWIKISAKVLERLQIKWAQLLGAMITAIYDADNQLLKINSALLAVTNQESLYLKIPNAYLNMISNTTIHLQLIYHIEQ